MHSMGGMVKHEAHLVCVLYDPADGRILHMHHDVVLPGGRPVSEEQVEAAARDQLRKRGKHRDGLHVLHVPPEDVSSPGKYAVHPVEKRLIRA